MCVFCMTELQDSLLHVAVSFVFMLLLFLSSFIVFLAHILIFSGFGDKLSSLLL